MVKFLRLLYMGKILETFPNFLSNINNTEKYSIFYFLVLSFH